MDNVLNADVFDILASFVDASYAMATERWLLCSPAPRRCAPPRFGTWHATRDFQPWPSWWPVAEVFDSRAAWLAGLRADCGIQ
jgi:hypothetical protein